jgi:P27 family predicted phage terminase small subunit
MAPEHLSEEMRRWWEHVNSAYVLSDHHKLLLTHAAESWDRANQARRQIDEEGITTADRFDQVKAHPAIAIERDSRAAFARLIRQLDLEGEADALYRRN